MKKIACVGYHGTGAGVIDDLFREFDNVCHGTYEAEIRILHDPDGVSDLEYHLVKNPHRLGTGIAIKRLIKYGKTQNRQASKIYGDEWMKMINEYAEDLALIKYKGYNEFDLQFAPISNILVFYAKKVINRLKPLKYRKAPWYNYLPNLESYYSLLTEKEFLSKTKRFVDKMCAKANKENKEYLMLDQFISSSNPAQSLKYIDNVKTIIVDRDPRDLFINQVLCCSPVLPREPHAFCVVYRNIRKVFGNDCKDKVMKVHFEDLIFHYDDYVQKIIDFVGISESHHVNKRKFFDPDDSGTRTQLWLKFPQFKNAIEVIEKELPEFLYDFPQDIRFKKNTSSSNHHLFGKK